MRLAIVLILGSVIGGGCAEYKSADKKTTEKTETKSEVMVADRTMSMAEATGGLGAGPGQTPKGVERKIIYSVKLDIWVKQFDGVQQQIETLVKQYQGAYISEATLSGTKGWRRGGQWTIRVPQEKYEDMVGELRKLGEVREENKRSEEVTEEFYDLSARLKNKKETEKRLLKIQEERTGELEHVLTAEREIARVREEIEQMEGRLNRLNDLTSLTTVKLSVEEIQAFQGEELAFADRVSGAWSDSVGGLRDAGEGFTLFLVALAPWLPILILIVLGVRLLWRRVFRRKPRPAAA
jgi:hypothetical protein